MRNVNYKPQYLNEDKRMCSEKRCCCKEKRVKNNTY